MTVDPIIVDAGNQISGANYKFANKSNVDIQVDLTFEATGNATLMAEDEVIQNDAENTDKDAYMAILAAKEATANDFTGLDYDETDTDILFPLADDGDGNDVAAVSFLLAKGVNDGAAVATGTAGIAAFTFYGKLNPYAAWESNDLTLTAAYELNPVPHTAYDTAVNEGLKGLNVVPGAGGSGGGGAAYAGPGFIVALATQNAVTVTVDKSDLAATDYEIPFYFGDGITAPVISLTNSGGNAVYSAALIDYDTTRNVLILGNNFFVPSAVTPSLAGNSTTRAALKLTVDGTVYALTIYTQD
jgi:hypothetical protein